MCDVFTFPQSAQDIELILYRSSLGPVGGEQNKADTTNNNNGSDQLKVYGGPDDPWGNVWAADNYPLDAGLWEAPATLADSVTVRYR